MMVGSVAKENIVDVLRYVQLQTERKHIFAIMVIIAFIFKMKWKQIRI